MKFKHRKLHWQKPTQKGLVWLKLEITIFKRPFFELKHNHFVAKIKNHIFD